MSVSRLFSVLLLATALVGCSTTAATPSGSPASPLFGTTQGQQGIGQLDLRYNARPDAVSRAARLAIRSRGFAIDTSKSKPRLLVTHRLEPSLADARTTPLRALRARIDSLRDGRTRIDLQFHYVRERSLDRPVPDDFVSPEDAARQLLTDIQRRVGQRGSLTN